MIGNHILLTFKQIMQLFFAVSESCMCQRCWVDPSAIRCAGVIPLVSRAAEGAQIHQFPSLRGRKKGRFLACMLTLLSMPMKMTIWKLWWVYKIKLLKTLLRSVLLGFVLRFPNNKYSNLVIWKVIFLLKEVCCNHFCHLPIFIPC